MRRLGLSTLATLMLMIVVSAVSATVFVKPMGNDALDGSSWDLAKATVQAGVDAASSPGGGEVWVAAGTYHERITMKMGVALYGGFAGTETDRSLRDWVLNVTTLDGSKKGSVINVSTGMDPLIVIDGFTIANGQAAKGGGIVCYNSCPTISNNRIISNKATVSGGGIYCDGDAYSIVITGNTISSNTAPSGGGICCMGGTNACTILSNLISSNKATSAWGGAILTQSYGAVLQSNIIKSNTAAISGGGIYCAAYASVMSCLITGNTSVTGGGIRCASDMDLINNTFAGNKAVVKDATGNSVPGDGGAFYCSMDVVLNLRQNLVSLNNPGMFVSSILPLDLAGNCLYANTGYDCTGTVSSSAYTELDPQFSNPSAGDYHLLPTSPCVDAGSPTVVTSALDAEGKPRLYGATVDVGALEWQPSPPVNSTILPSSGILPIGKKYTITTKYTDVDGFGAITECYLLLNTSLSEVGGIDLKLDVKNNLVYMMDDTGTTWTGGLVPGTPYTIVNSSCVVYCSGMSVVGSTNTLTVKWQIVLRPNTAGLAYGAWLQCMNSYGLSDPWEQKANLTVSSDIVHEPVNVSLDPHSGSIPVETKTTFTSVYSDGDGASNLYGGHLLFTTDGTLFNAAYFKFDFNANRIWLKDDAAVNWLGGYTPGSTKVIENSFCKLYCADTKKVESGNTVTVSWVTSFKTAKVGKKPTAYMLTWDDGGLFADWTKMGTITLASTGTNQAPVNVSLSPNSGNIQSGVATTFTGVYSDADGVANLGQCYLLINDRLSESYADDVKYDANTNLLYLKNDSGSAWLGGFAPGSVSTIENTFCKLDCSGTSTSSSGNSLTVNYSIILKPITAGGTGYAWLQSVDDAGAKDAWEKFGTFSIL